MSWQSVFDMLSKLKFFMATKLPLLLCLPRNTIARSEKHEPSTEHIVYCFRSGSKFMALRCHCTVYRVEKRACRTAPRNDNDYPLRTTDFRSTQARTQAKTRQRTRKLQHDHANRVGCWKTLTRNLHAINDYGVKPWTVIVRTIARRYHPAISCLNNMYTLYTCPDTQGPGAHHTDRARAAGRSEFSVSFLPLPLPPTLCVERIYSPLVNQSKTIHLQNYFIYCATIKV